MRKGTKSLRDAPETLPEVRKGERRGVPKKHETAPPLVSRSPGFSKSDGLIKAAYRALKPGQTESILDVGGGIGKFARLINHPKSYIVDIDPEYLNQAKGYVQKYLGRAEELNFNDNAFDYVLCVQALYQFEDWKRALLEMLRVAKKRIVVTHPNFSYIELRKQKTQKPNVWDYEIELFLARMNKKYRIVTYSSSLSMIRGLRTCSEHIFVIQGDQQ